MPSGFVACFGQSKVRAVRLISSGVQKREAKRSDVEKRPGVRRDHSRAYNMTRWTGVITETEPSDHLPLQSTHGVDGDHQRDVTQLELRHLEHERLLEERVRLTTTYRRLAARHLLAGRRHQSQLHRRVCTANGRLQFTSSSEHTTVITIRHS